MCETKWVKIVLDERGAWIQLTAKWNKDDCSAVEALESGLEFSVQKWVQFKLRLSFILVIRGLNQHIQISPEKTCRSVTIEDHVSQNALDRRSSSFLQTLT